MKLVQFGAGNIGRSFIGQIFSRAGWEVVFIDIDKKIITEINKRHEYRVEIKDRVPQTIHVRNVRGVLAQDIEAVTDEVCTCDIAATAVGKDALMYIVKPIATGLVKRLDRFSFRPLDIILCENMLNAASFFREALRRHLPEDFPLDSMVGLVETSIGKMVPIMSEEERVADPLLVYAEAYNTLILDRKGFRGPIPDVPELELKENMKPYVDRKLFIHNMGHAVLGYISHVFYPDYRYVWEAAENDELFIVTRDAMWESGAALISRYPEEFNNQSIGEYIDDLLIRFKNRALGDTIFRVGRDLYRKLGPEDRLIGSIRLCIEQGIKPINIALGTASALLFRGVDEDGNLFPQDRVFHDRELSKGVNHVLENVSRLKNEDVKSLIRHYYSRIKGGARDIEALLSEVKGL
ncbi:MAG: mannitol-1-phosphate 5-dehydrogenase [Spirochaetota bacterium]